MTKYRKKPVVVEAVQFIEGQPLPEGVGGVPSIKFFHVNTIHGYNSVLEYGDWVITEPDGVHHHPCKPDIFEQTYEAVE